MRYVTAVSLLAASSLALFGREKPALAKPDTASVQQTLMQLERDWNQATIAKDFKTVDRIVADEWVAIDFRGVTVTKAESMEELKSGESSNQSVELGEMTVKVFGNTAVVMGTDTEKSTYHGVDSSGKYAWMDVFVKRGGRWQAVASQTTKIGK